MSGRLRAKPDLALASKADAVVEIADHAFIGMVAQL